jgi:tRNA (pseudouridine54-N1)-methyltransferase
LRRIVLVGQKALASPDFLLDDLAGTSGRLDVLVRALRASLLVSHGVRADVVAYLVLLGGPRAPRSVRFQGERARFLRPEERSLATLLKKVLAAPEPEVGEGAFGEVRQGIAVARGGLAAVLADTEKAPLYVLEEGAPDVRSVPVHPAATFVFGDHLGFDPQTRGALEIAGAVPVGLGPVSVHVEDAVAVLMNELDRYGGLP